MFELCNETDVVRFRPLTIDPTSFVEITCLRRVGKVLRLRSRLEFTREAARQFYAIVLAKGYQRN